MIAQEPSQEPSQSTATAQEIALKSFGMKMPSQEPSQEPSQAICKKHNCKKVYVRETTAQERATTKVFNGKPQLKIYRCDKCIADLTAKRLSK